MRKTNRGATGRLDTLQIIREIEKKVFLLGINLPFYACIVQKNVSTINATGKGSTMELVRTAPKNKWLHDTRVKNVADTQTRGLDKGLDPQLTLVGSATRSCQFPPQNDYLLFTNSPMLH